MGWHSLKDDEEWGFMKNVTVMTRKNVLISSPRGQKCQTETGLWGEPNSRPVCR